MSSEKPIEERARPGMMELIACCSCVMVKQVPRPFSWKVGLPHWSDKGKFPKIARKTVLVILVSDYWGVIENYSGWKSKTTSPFKSTPWQIRESVVVLQYYLAAHSAWQR
jgi:hypothetical protein